MRLKDPIAERVLDRVRENRPITGHGDHVGAVIVESAVQRGGAPADIFAGGVAQTSRIRGSAIIERRYISTA